MPAWRDAALVEHRGTRLRSRGRAGRGAARQRESLDVRGDPCCRDGVYVEYANGEREYYDLHSDPYELTNTYPELSPLRVNALHARLASLESCRGAATCQQAAGHRP